MLLLLIFKKQKLSNWLSFSVRFPGACFLCLQWRLLADFAACPWASTLQTQAVKRQLVGKWEVASPVK